MTITLDREQYEVIEGDGKVEVCATLDSTYDVDCAVPRDFHVSLNVINETAGNRK